VTVLDIADRTRPRLTRELVFGGSYLNSRRIGDVVHTAVVYPEARGPELPFWPKGLPRQYCGLADLGITEEQVLHQFEKLRRANLQRIETTPVRDLLPTV